MNKNLSTIILNQKQIRKLSMNENIKIRIITPIGEETILIKPKLDIMEQIKQQVKKQWKKKIKQKKS